MCNPILMWMVIWESMNSIYLDKNSGQCIHALFAVYRTKYDIFIGGDYDWKLWLRSFTYIFLRIYHVDRNIITDNYDKIFNEKINTNSTCWYVEQVTYRDQRMNLLHDFIR